MSVELGRRRAGRIGMGEEGWRVFLVGEKGGGRIRIGFRYMVMVRSVVSGFEWVLSTYKFCFWLFFVRRVYF